MRNGQMTDSPVTIEEREALLGEVQQMYQQRVQRGFRYERFDADDPRDESGEMRTVPTEGSPPIDEWLEEYNKERTHTGRYCFGKTPWQTFLDSKHLAEEKMLDKLQPTANSDVREVSSVR